MKAIIFDFDGVIHDTLDISYDINLIVNGEMTLDEYKDMYNGNLYKNKIITPEKSLSYFELSQLEYAKLIIEDNIKEELLKLKEKYSLFIISSNTEKILNAYFEKNNASRIFTQILGFETHKSKVEKFKILFDKYNLHKDDCIFVTDTLGDLLEASKIGIKAIAVDYGFHDRARLEKGNPVKIVSHFTEILPAIEDIKRCH